MIDADKAPRTSRAYRKMEKEGLLDKNMRELLAELAVAEEHARKTAARLGVQDALITNLEQLCPPTIDRDLLTPVDLRQRLKTMSDVLLRSRKILEQLI